MERKSILLVSATELEIKPLLDEQIAKIENKLYRSTIKSNNVEILITGVGIHAMTYALTRLLSKNQYSFIILAGISGSNTNTLKLGNVVNVMSEQFADLGAQSDKGFLSLFDMGLQDANEWPFAQGVMHNYTLINNAAVDAMKAVAGSTVQTIQNKLECKITTNTDVESMEAAAFFYCCMMEKLPFIQIRSISNFVGEGDKSKWDIPLAVQNLNNALVSIFNEIGE